MLLNKEDPLLGTTKTEEASHENLETDGSQNLKRNAS